MPMVRFCKERERERTEKKKKEKEEKAEGLKENSVKVSAPTLHSSMVCETVENGKLKRLMSRT